MKERTLPGALSGDFHLLTKISHLFKLAQGAFSPGYLRLSPNEDLSRLEISDGFSLRFEDDDDVNDRD